MIPNVTLPRIASIRAKLIERFRSFFGGLSTIDGLDADVWSEGGEWPLLEGITDRLQSRPSEFAYPSLETCFNVKTAISLFMSSAPRDVGIALPCGTGKSTQLVAELLDAVSVNNIICIEPSFTIADALTSYMSSVYSPTLYSRQYDETRIGVTYMSASEFIDLLHKSKDLPDTLIIIDEYHHATPVYAALPVLLNRLSSRILCLSACDSAELRSRPSVTTHPYATYDIHFDELIRPVKMDDVENKVLIVGAHQSYLNAYSANYITGLTLDITSVIDLGRRMDPTIVSDKLRMTTRAATTLELTQSLGRLSRTKTQGHSNFYYIKQSSRGANHGDNVALYPSIYSAILSAFELGPYSSTSAINCVLRCEKSSDTSAHSRHASRKVSSSGSRRSSSSSIHSSRVNVIPPDSKVSKTKSGYFVSKQYDSRLKELFSTRASSWVVSADDYCVPQHNRSLMTLQEFNNLSLSDPSTSQNKLPQPSTSIAPLHPYEHSLINNILSGEVMPSYSQDELNLVTRAFNIYSLANAAVPSHARLHFNLQRYLAAYKTLRGIRES